MKRSATALATLALVLLSARPAAAEFDASQTQEGIQIGLTDTVLGRATKGLDLKTGKPDKRVLEYTSVTACRSSQPGQAGANEPCSGAIQACAGNTPEEGQGPMVRLFRREVDAMGAATTGWQLIGTTCFPDLAPDKSVRGLGDALKAFHDTRFALPTVHIQPEGNLTLVTLPTYFEVRWPTRGFKPGDVDATTLLDQRIRIRPTLVGYTYVFGDQTSFGPTPSPGGIYPNGDITHAYERAGTYNTHIDVTYGGQFSVDGGAWVTIPDTVLKSGPSQPLTVKTAQARLVR